MCDVSCVMCHVSCVMCNDGSRDHGVLTSASMAESGLKRKGFRCARQINQPPAPLLPPQPASLQAQGVPERPQQGVRRGQDARAVLLNGAEWKVVPPPPGSCRRACGGGGGRDGRLCIGNDGRHASGGRCCAAAERTACDAIVD